MSHEIDIIAAVQDWNNALYAAGSSDRLTTPIIANDTVHIVIDDGICGYAIANTDILFRTMQICASRLYNPGVSSAAYVSRVWRHEFGRMLGLGTPLNCDPTFTVMVQIGPEDMTATAASTLGCGDLEYINRFLRDPDPDPPLDACQQLLAEGYILPGGYYPGQCQGDNQTEYSMGDCCVGTASPLVLSLSTEPISFSSAADGVPFDIGATGTKVRVAWPSSHDTAWLAYDRNRNERIDDGTELFGNFTPVGCGRARNGFEALRVFDSNGDGTIDRSDERFDELLVWRDENRNGISEAGELSRLADVGITEISLAYVASRHRDRWGNVFHYRAEARATTAPRTRQIYDVYPKMISLQ